MTEFLPPALILLLGALLIGLLAAVVAAIVALIALAGAIGGAVVPIDALARDYIGNLQKIGRKCRFVGCLEPAVAPAAPPRHASVVDVQDLAHTLQVDPEVEIPAIRPGGKVPGQPLEHERAALGGVLQLPPLLR